MLFADLKLRPEAETLVNEHANPTNADLGKAVFQETDVAEWKQLERMFSVVKDHFGGVDIVVPGAGVYEPVCLHSTLFNNAGINIYVGLVQLLVSSWKS